MTWMVTGGAGYIGAHVVRAMVADGWPVMVYDDLSTGSTEHVPAFSIGSCWIRRSMTTR
jgi:UDP-glucose 4-epimerase